VLKRATSAIKQRTDGKNRKQFCPTEKKQEKLFISNSDMFKNTFCRISRGSERFPYFPSEFIFAITEKRGENLAKNILFCGKIYLGREQGENGNGIFSPSILWKIFSGIKFY
jgi:hypothetical protein